jgi:structure-specific endonuclease subunit SLX1
MDVVTEIENFFGVYLLVNNNENPKFNGRCYVGFTVDPNRRINQHNKGKKYGGAGHTSRVPGPWTMVMIIHNFPDNISALRFEWAWQEPKASRRLKNIPSIQKKKPSESHFQYHFRIITEMINLGPWNRLPLKIRWLEQDFCTQFPSDRLPQHITIVHGPIKAKKTRIGRTDSNKELFEAVRARKECHLCMEEIANLQDDRVFCINPRCKLVSHLRCLARICLQPGHYVPIQGVCPLCDLKFLWGNVIRKKKGCKDKDVQFEDGDDDYDI